MKIPENKTGFWNTKSLNIFKGDKILTKNVQHAENFPNKAAGKISCYPIPATMCIQYHARAIKRYVKTDRLNTA